ncbi:hypothetical protein D5086_027240 [Populus alba]|uniref:Uncharacterized protein n=1 Tax=Populus alba TaxID=43335 RepID=A0ACC4AVM6_POPAL
MQMASSSGSQHMDQVKSVITLRSGKVIEKPILEPCEKDDESISLRVRINIPLLDAIKQVPSYAKFLKDLCTVKRKLNVKKKAFLAEQVSAILQNNNALKYKDPGCPTISCFIGEHKIERALLDLGASVNLLPYSVFQSLNLGRPFLATSNALINCRNGLMKLSFGNMTLEMNIFNIYKQPGDDNDLQEVDFIKKLVHDQFQTTSSETEIDESDDLQMVYFQESKACNWRPQIEELPPRSIEPIPSSVQPPKPELKPLPFNLKYSFLGENETFPQMGKSYPSCTQKSGVTVITNEKNELIPTRTVTGWRMCIDYRKLNSMTRKDHFPLPFMDQILERVAGHEFYCFLDGYQVTIKLKLHWKIKRRLLSHVHLVTFAYRRMPFGLCNAPATFQRCMLSIFSDMVERFLEIFMDDFSVFGDSFDDCLTNLEKVLSRCEEKNLVLNWEKCHFMVTNGIVLGHIVSSKGIEVDKSKIELIANLPTPKSVKDVRSFLGHAGFYRRFIKDFSVISKPLSNLLTKDNIFEWTEHCEEAFVKLKNLLTSAPVIQPPDWSLPFEIMCDASDYVVVLSWDKGKIRNLMTIASSLEYPRQKKVLERSEELLLG